MDHALRDARGSTPVLVDGEGAATREAQPDPLGDDLGAHNKGRVEFSTLTGDDGSEQVGVKMTIVYKLPRLVAMITRDKGENGAVKKTVQRIIQADLKRFKRAMERDGAAGEDA